MKNKFLIHAAQDKIDKLKYIGQYPKESPKYGYHPRGIWYALEYSWLEFCNQRLPGHLELYKYLYRIVPRYTTLNKSNMNKVLQIKNEEDFDNFTFKYGYLQKRGKYSPYINIRWDEVANDFAGIEVIPVIDSRRGLLFSDIRENPKNELLMKYKEHGINITDWSTMFWYRYFNGPEGVIWNPAGIKQFKQLENKCLENYCKNVQKQILIHISSEPIKELYYIPQHKPGSERYGFKPRGIWYSPGKAWLDYCNQEIITIDRYSYFYVIVPRYTTLNKPNINRVLKIDNESDFDLFTFKYGYLSGYSSNHISLKWDEVEKDFGGIEIIPFLYHRVEQPFWIRGDSLISDQYRKNLIKKYRKNGLDVTVGTTITWYAGFDIPSGCIWNPNVIKKIYQIKKNICQGMKKLSLNKMDLKELTLNKV